MKTGINIQQVPEVMKPCIIPEPGNVFVSFDASAIEPRLIAYFTEDENLCSILMSDGDFHGDAAIRFFQLPCDNKDVKELHTLERDTAKKGDLSIFYGAGGKRWQLICIQKGFSKPIDVCKSDVKRFLAGYPGVQKFKRQLDRDLERGKVVENILGRLIYFNEAKDVYMKGFNRLIQGSASDLILQSAVKTLKEVRHKNIIVKPKFFVHDEIVLECKKEDANYVAEVLVDNMTKWELNTKWGHIPLRVEGGVIEHWQK